MMEIESAEQSESKNTKLIDGNYVIDLNSKLGGGSYSQVFISWLKTNPAERFACKVISKVDLDKQVLLPLPRSRRRRATTTPS
jgi:hypothetical protein